MKRFLIEVTEEVKTFWTISAEDVEHAESYVPNEYEDCFEDEYRHIKSTKVIRDKTDE